MQTQIFTPIPIIRVRKENPSSAPAQTKQKLTPHINRLERRREKKEKERKKQWKRRYVSYIVYVYVRTYELRAHTGTTNQLMRAPKLILADDFFFVLFLFFDSY